MAAIAVRLTRREEVARGTMAFHFEKPPGFGFTPGQAIDLILPDPAGTHAFSIVIAPHEEELVVATRMRASAFKNALGQLPIGARVQVDGPWGSLTLHSQAERPAVLLAGGIGITPFMSMLRHAAHAQLRHRLLLLYSNRTPEDTAFLPELQQLEIENRHFRVVPVMSQSAGRIDDALLRQITDGPANPIYYVAGPAAMVAALRDALKRAGAGPDHVRSEEFHGYCRRAWTDARSPRRSPLTLTRFEP